MKVEITAIALAATLANANLSYQSQDRSITASANLFTGNQSYTVSSGDFSDFNESYTGGFTDIQGGADAFASQDSSLQAFGMTASGTAGGSYGPPAGSSSGFGRSYFAVDFTVDTATQYTLDFWGASDGGSYSFVGGSMDFTGFFAGSRSFIETGELEVGSYSFLIDLNTYAEYGSGGFGFDFQTIPAPSSLGLVALGAFASTRRRR